MSTFVSWPKAPHRRLVDADARTGIGAVAVTCMQRVEPTCTQDCSSNNHACEVSSVPPALCSMGQSRYQAPNVSVSLSDATTIPSSLGKSMDTPPSLDTDESGQELLLLKTSQPARLGGYPGCYVVKLVRTSLDQLFYLDLFAATKRDGQLSAIFASDDLPYVGISRWDRLLSINGVEPKSVEECCIMVKHLLSLVLVLQFKGARWMGPVPRPIMALVPPADRWLLTVTKDILTNHSDFVLIIKRQSPKLRVDLPVGALPNSMDLDRGPLFVARDLPHLHVLAGDEFLAVNGCRSPCRTMLCEILDTALTLELTLRRGTRMARPPPLEQLGFDASDNDPHLKASDSLVDSNFVCAVLGREQTLCSSSTTSKCLSTLGREQTL